MKNVSFRRNGVEFEPTKQELKIVLDDYAKRLCERDKRIADLEKKLAGKETRIAELEDKDWYEGTIKQLEEQNERLIKERDSANDQDKIDFVIEQLEKVKKFVIRQLFIITKDCSDLDEAEAKGCNELREEIIKEIDNQIKELRGQE